MKKPLIAAVILAISLSAIAKGGGGGGHGGGGHGGGGHSSGHATSHSGTHTGHAHTGARTTAGSGTTSAARRPFLFFGSHGRKTGKYYSSAYGGGSHYTSTRTDRDSTNEKRR